MKPDYAAIGLRLKKARNLKKITQQQIADSLGVSVSYIKNIERGGKPSIEFLLTVSEMCGTPVDWLLTGDHANLQTQKVEAIFDPDLKRMIDILKELMESDKPHQRSWTILQFENAFKEHCAAHDEKKIHA